MSEAANQGWRTATTGSASKIGLLLRPSVAEMKIPSAAIKSFAFDSTKNRPTRAPIAVLSSGWAMGFVMGVMRIANAAVLALAGVMFANGMTRSVV